MNGNDYYELEQSYLESHIEELFETYKGRPKEDKIDPWDFYDNDEEFQNYCHEAFEAHDSGRGDAEYDAYKERQLT